MKLKGCLVTVLLVAILLGTTGCPISSTFQKTFEYLYVDFEYGLKGLCIYWFRDYVILNPNIIYITIPHLTTLSLPVGVIGKFGINNDQEGPDEFSFNVVSNGSFLFINFAGNGTFSGGDIRIDWNPTMRRFEIDHPFGGLGVQPGFYYLQFFPGLLPMEDDEPCWDVTVEMMNEELTVKRNKLLCMNTCFMPTLGYANLSGLVLGTAYVVYNVNPVANRVAVKYYEQDGEDFAPRGTASPGFPGDILEAAPNSSQRVQPAIDPGQSGVKVVWARASGEWPISCALDFVATDASEAPSPQGAAGNLLGEAGIAASGVDTLHMLNIVKTSSADTALAIVNPTSADATINARLLDINNQQVASATLDVLLAKNQRSVFFSQLFQGLAPGDFEGTLILDSDTDIAVATLQTDAGGIQQSSLPSANRQMP